MTEVSLDLPHNQQGHRLRTPNLTKFNSSSNDSDVSPTLPLHIKNNIQSKPQETLSSPFKNNSPTFQSSQSLNSIITKESEQSFSTANSYQTAMESNRPQSTASLDEYTNDTTMRLNEEASTSIQATGLGIERINLVDANTSKNNFQFDDDPTPKVNNYTFSPQQQRYLIDNEDDDYEYQPPSATTKVTTYGYEDEVDDDDETPVLSNTNVFPQSTTQHSHQHHASVRYNVTPAQEGGSFNTTPFNHEILSTAKTSQQEPSRQKFTSSDITSSDNPQSRVLSLPNGLEPRPISQTSLREVIPSHIGDYSHTNEFSFANDTTYSQESTYLNDLDKGKRYTANILGEMNTEALRPKSRPLSQLASDDSDYITLYLTALHSFDANTLELTADSAICLSFDKNEAVFVHSIDSSGWAEVTLIKTLKRGWVPVNFFTELIKDDPTLPLSRSRTPLKELLISSAKFLNNPLENPANGDAPFSINLINDIRDGVRSLLEKTDCLSRSTDIVKKKPIIRKMRKSLLADWYSLMIKANSYKHSKNAHHLETLQLMVLQVVKKAVVFLEIWSLESEALRLENESQAVKPKKITPRPNNIPTLSNAPFAKERLNEIHTILFSYIGLLLGRLDMVEHNPAGCQLLETLTHQMILLLRELLAISKSCSLILNDRNTKADNKFDDNLDTLLSLVSELVSSVKNFITKTIHEDYSTRDIKVKDGLYYYTTEGDDLIGIVSRMTRSISAAVENCYKQLSLIGDFRLSADKQYPDFRSAQITPEQFIKTCSVGMIKTLNHQDEKLKSLKRSNIKRLSRFSMVRSGLGNDNTLTSSGTNLLQEFLPDSKSFVRNSVFEPYLNESSEELRILRDVKSEIVRDPDNRLIGASFGALVYLLTNELEKADVFFTSTFFLTFKLYSTGEQFIEELIARFNLDNSFDENEDVDDTGKFSSDESRLKTRRKLICRTFQLWLQSYWDYQNDYNLLPTLINFFNEGVSQYLPIESKKLIEVCSKLTVLTPSKIKNTENSLTLFNNLGSGNASTDNFQLIKRNPGLAKHTSLLSHSSSIYSISSLNKELDNDDYIFEEYELAKVSTNNRSSMLLPLPGLNFNHNSLLNKSQILDLENLVLVYRRFLGKNSWVHDDYTHYYPVELSKLLTKWFKNSQIQLPHDVKIEYNLVELNSFELAKQLTIIESKIFLSIKPEEFLNQNFSEKRSKLNLSPNVGHSLLFTNLLSEYVLDSILDSSISSKKQVSRLKNWLNVALSCYYLKNFNSLAAIIISLQNHILTRLDGLWKSLPEKYSSLFGDLKKIIHPNNNYKGYRYKLSKLLEDNDQKSPIPVVPYINLFVHDLTLIQEGNKDFRNSNSFLRSQIINFDKFLRISKTISNMEYLQVGYDTATPRKLSKRNSIFSFTSSNYINEELSPILPLQEFILLEFWRVHQLNLRDSDRYWNLSKAIQN